MTCSIDMHFPRADLDEAMRLLHSVVGVTEARQGCRACTVIQDAVDDSRVLYSEVWDSRNRFHEHVRTDEFRRVLLAMDMCCEQPQVFVENLAGRRGLAHLRTLRGARET